MPCTPFCQLDPCTFTRTVIFAKGSHSVKWLKAWIEFYLCYVSRVELDFYIYCFIFVTNRFIDFTREFVHVFILNSWQLQGWSCLTSFMLVCIFVHSLSYYVHRIFRVYEKYGILHSPITFTSWMGFGVPLSLALVIIVWIWLQFFFLRCKYVTQISLLVLFVCTFVMLTVSIKNKRQVFSHLRRNYYGHKSRNIGWRTDRQDMTLDTVFGVKPL